MFQTFRNAWKIPELKSRLLFTLGILIVYRLGSAIPVPFVSGDALTAMFANGSMLTYLDMMSGGALSRCTIFALGVTPYINASIIVQLLCFAIPYLENLAKESDGQNKIRQITRYVGGGIALVLSIGYYFLVRNMGALKYTAGAAGVFTAIVVILTFTAGAQLTTWCGEQIDDKGIGNGVSLIIFASIVSNWSSVTTMVADMLTRASSGQPLYYVLLPLLVVMALAVVVFIVIMTNAERRITIQYAKRVVGRKQMGGQNTYLPLKLNMSGVMPIIFASSLLMFPQMIMALFVPNSDAYTWYATYMGSGTAVYYVLLALFILFFSYFYAQIQFNPDDVSKNIQQYGGFIPGIRAGKPTSDFLRKISNRITLFGALFLMIIALVPTFIFQALSAGGQLGFGNAFSATGLLIVVSVALELNKQLESQIMMKHYKGFLK